MDDLLEGRFNYEKAREAWEIQEGVLEFSSLGLELFLQKGETLQGSFIITGPEDGFAEGYIYSSEFRMECFQKEFIGKKEEIIYRFSSEGMEEGDVLEGQFSIISNYGEYELPYRVEVTRSIVSSSMGEIKNMFHFANLAKANWEEAVTVFYSKEFENIFINGNDRQYYGAYKGLSAVYGNPQNMEEFLLEINKKQGVEYIPEATEVCIEDPYDVAEHSLTLVRNGWGYTSLRIESEGEFLRAEKERISDDDFLGNSFRLNYYIDSEKLHAGRNYGRIHIFNSHTSIEVPVTVIHNTEQKRTLGLRREKKNILLQLMYRYDAFRMKRINSRTWIKETEDLVDRLASLDEKDLQTSLFRIQLLITQERFNEAEWQLERIKSMIDEAECPPEIYCYYLYLTTLNAKEAAYVDQVSQRVERIFYGNRNNWRIAWLMLYLSEEYEKSPSRRFVMLEDQYHRGARSPVLYVEAWHLIERNPTLLMKLGDFEIQVLNYAAKRGVLSQDLMIQVRYLALKLKIYSRTVFYILSTCYEKYPDKETLQVICTLLIKGGKTAHSYFKWYRLGVEQELRITKLYEHYMMSLPKDYDETLPKIILMYFSYQSELDYRKNAFLYAYIYKRRQEQPELYISYCERIERFVLDQIRNGRINEDLAYLYKNTISARMVKADIAKELAKLLFVHQFTIESRDIRHVIVRYSIHKTEYCYPVNDKTAWVPLYGRDYTILLEDGEGNRYCKSIPFQIKQMMSPDGLLPLITPYVQEHMGLAIHICEGNGTGIKITKDNEKRLRYLASEENIDDRMKSELRLLLVHHYYEEDDMHMLDSYLEELTTDDMNKKARGEILRILVVRGMYDRAFAWIRSFGVDGVEIKTIVRLCSRLIARDGLMEEEGMTFAVYYAFSKGKYDGNLLTYLVHFYSDAMKRMLEVWKAATAFEAETYPLCERILVQMLFSGAYVADRMDIFKAYVSGGARMPVESAFLFYCAYNYFVRDKEVDEFIFTDIVRVYDRGEELHKVCKLAFLKYYAVDGRKSRNVSKISAVIKKFLGDMLEENIYFPFFREYTKEMLIMQQFADKTMIEYKVRAGHKAVIHYMLERGDLTEKEYRREEMRDMYGGICVKAFVLFFGEKLQYYITEEGDGEERLTQRTSISKSDILQGEEEDKFGLLNDIVIARTLQDYHTVDSLLEEYYRKEYMALQLFGLRR